MQEQERLTIEAECRIAVAAERERCANIVVDYYRTSGAKPCSLTDQICCELSIRIRNAK